MSAPSLAAPARLLAALLLLLAGVATAAAAELVMVERPGCIWCARWNAAVAPIHPKTPEGKAAPLVRIDIAEVAGRVAVKAPVVFTPTFLLVEGGRELDRITGYADEAMFWGLLAELLRRHGLPAT